MPHFCGLLIVRARVNSEVNVVERQWHGVAPDGTEHVVSFRIGTPTRQEHGEWAANVVLIPMDPVPHAIFGIDSWQAVNLGMQHITVMAKHYYKLGWRFYWERGGDEAPPSDLERSTA